MSISDFIHAISLMLPPSPDSSCKLQGFLLQYSGISSVLWSFNIAYSLYMTAIHQEKTPVRFQTKFLLLAYLIPFLIALIPFFTDSYNEAVGWCWIKKDFVTDLTERIFCFYLIIWTVIPFNLSVYWRVINKIKQEYGAILDYQLHQNSVIKRLSLYPMILILCYLPITLKRTLEIGGQQILPFWFTCLSAFGISITGLINAIVYGFSEPVREEIKGLCIKDSRAQTSFSLYSQSFAVNFVTTDM